MLIQLGRTLLALPSETRWYPQEIQQLVSTHKFSYRGQYSGLDHGPTQIKVPQSGQVFIGGGGGVTLDQLKREVPTSLTIFISGGGGGGGLGCHIPRILGNGGTPGILTTKSSHPSLALASQIVSHTLCVWRLTTIYLLYVRLCLAI